MACRAGALNQEMHVMHVQSWKHANRGNYSPHDIDDYLSSADYRSGCNTNSLFCPAASPAHFLMKVLYL